MGVRAVLPALVSADESLVKNVKDDTGRRDVFLCRFCRLGERCIGKILSW